MAGDFSIDAENGKATLKNGDVLQIVDAGIIATGSKNKDAIAKKTVKGVLRKLRGTSVVIKTDGKRVIFDKTFEKEYTESKDTTHLGGKEKGAKFNAASSLKAIIEDAKNPRWENDRSAKHGDKAQNGWNYYDISFVAKFGTDYYRVDGKLNVRINDKNENRAYDITDIELEVVQTGTNPHQGQPLVTNSITPESENASTKYGANRRNSVKIDSAGRKLTEGQQEYFADSKIRDDEGNLIVVYHGTPYGGFTEFKNNFNYFTANKEYADRYHI